LTNREGAQLNDRGGVESTGAHYSREGTIFTTAPWKDSMECVSFHEEGKDAFGKPMERQVNKRIYSIREMQ